MTHNGSNAFEEAWVNQLLLTTGGAMQPQSSDDCGASWNAGSNVAKEDADIQKALQLSVAQHTPPAGQPSISSTEDEELQRALRESAESATDRGIRRLMSAEGPFFPAGIVNSGNSCFFNSLLQVLFAVTPIFRGALFQQISGEGNENSSSLMAVLRLLRELFAKMDMGLIDAIDAGDLYRLVFDRADEADVSEQTHRLFEILSKGPPPLRTVFTELFSGDLYEHLAEHSVRTVPLEFCQLDLCVTKSTTLDRCLEEHTRDVQGSVTRRSYRLPPVLWLNLDRFVYDRDAQSARKLEVEVSFPDVLNAWMLAPPQAGWARKLCESASRRQKILDDLSVNRQALQDLETNAGCVTTEQEESMQALVECQEALADELAKVEAVLLQQGEDQELIYHLQAVIVHRGSVNSGHYFAYTRSPCAEGPDWCCLNDSSVTLHSAEDMRQVCQGQDLELERFVSHNCEARDAESEHGVLQATEFANKDAANVPALEVITPVDSPALANVVSDVNADQAEKPATGSPQAVRKPGILSSMFGCLRKAETAHGLDDTDRAEVRVGAEVALASSSLPAAADPSAAPPMTSPDTSSLRDAEAVASCRVEEGESHRTDLHRISGSSPNVTAARCLVYARRCTNGDQLLAEVKNRVPSVLQECIDKHNLDLLRTSIEKVVADFAASTQKLSGPPSDSGPANVMQMACKVRTEGGMARARYYLLRESWRRYIPWLPDELSPTATPPDFRMFYGTSAKTMLIDALIQHGQHDMASLVISETSDTDSFIPESTRTWLAEHNF